MYIKCGTDPKKIRIIFIAKINEETKTHLGIVAWLLKNSNLPKVYIVGEINIFKAIFYEKKRNKDAKCSKL